MGKKRSTLSTGIPAPSAEPFYPLLPYPFKLKPIRDEVFYDSPALFKRMMRDELERLMLERMRKSHMLRIRFFIYLCKVGALIQQKVKEIDEQGMCSLEDLHTYMEVSIKMSRGGTKDDKYWDVLLQLNTALLHIGVCLQGLTTTSQVAGVASLTEAVKSSVKIPSLE